MKMPKLVMVFPFPGIGRPFQAVFSRGFLTTSKGRPTKTAAPCTLKLKIRGYWIATWRGFLLVDLMASNACAISSKNSAHEARFVTCTEVIFLTVDGTERMLE